MTVRWHCETRTNDRLLAQQLKRSEGGLEGPRGTSPALVAFDQLNASRPGPTSKASGGGTQGGGPFV
jgi:hypothetical protein